MIKDDGTVIHFNNPKVQASLSANTFSIMGHAETKQLTEMLPGILCQLGADGISNLRKLAEQFPRQCECTRAWHTHTVSQCHLLTTHQMSIKCLLAISNVTILQFLRGMEFHPLESCCGSSCGVIQVNGSSVYLSDIMFLAKISPLAKSQQH